MEKVTKTTDDATTNNHKGKKLMMNHRVMLTLQKGARYELGKSQLMKAFSKFGKVMRMVFNEDSSGSVGYLGWLTVAFKLFISIIYL